MRTKPKRKYYDWHNTHNQLDKKQWEKIFTNLYKKTKQKQAFDVQYRFLHFAQPTAEKLKQINRHLKDMICPRCENANENEKHWLFSCVSSQNLAIYVLNILEFVYWTDGNFDNTVEDILTLPLLHLEMFLLAETY